MNEGPLLKAGEKVRKDRDMCLEDPAGEGAWESSSLVVGDVDYPRDCVKCEEVKNPKRLRVTRSSACGDCWWESEGRKQEVPKEE